MGIILTSKIVTSGRLLYCQPEMVRPLTYLTDEAINICVGEWITTLLFWYHEKILKIVTNYNIENERKLKYMNKTELISAMAEKAEISKKDAEKALVAFTNVVADVLVDGGKVQMVGFGTFEVVERAERQGRNPATGEAITIAASKSPKFKAGKALKDAVKA